MDAREESRAQKNPDEGKGGIEERVRALNGISLSISRGGIWKDNGSVTERCVIEMMSKQKK